MRPTKKQRTRRRQSDLFDDLPDDIVISILCKLSASASCASDFFSVFSTCKRVNRLALHPLVLERAGRKTLVIEAPQWSESYHRFLKLCVNAGNIEACYVLGMIRFYCLQNRRGGASLMAKAAIKSHAAALYSLAVIQFNGSGGSKDDKNLRAGVALCARAALLGQVDALRELGHCFQDGYGVAQNIRQGRRLLVQANAREVASSLRAATKIQPTNPHRRLAGCGSECVEKPGLGCPLWSDYGYSVNDVEVHPVNQFLKGWFGSGMGKLDPGLLMCSHDGCGRPETRAHEFRRCSVCGKVNYCSRGCQALDWRLRHKAECVPMERWLDGGGHGGPVDGAVVAAEGAAVE